MSTPSKVRSRVPRRPSGPMVSPTGKKWELVNEPLDSPIVGDTAREAHGFLTLPRILRGDATWLGMSQGRAGTAAAPNLPSPRRMSPSGSKTCAARISIERLWKCFRIPSRADWRYFFPKSVSKDQRRWKHIEIWESNEMLQGAWKIKETWNHRRGTIIFQ